MPDVDIIQMNNGAAIGLQIYEIQVAPDAEAAEPGDAAPRGRRTWLELTQTVAPYAPQRDAALELLFVAEPAGGPGNAARTHIYLTVRKYGVGSQDVQPCLEGLRVSLESAMAAGGIDFAPVSYQSPALAAALGGVRGPSGLAVLRQERLLPAPPQGTPLTFGDPFAEEGQADLKRLLAALSRCPGAAVSLQLIPTLLTPQEQQGARQAAQRLNSLEEQDAEAQAAQAYYQRFVSHASSPLFMFGLFALGEQSASSALANALQTSLQYDDDGVARTRLMAAPAQLVGGDLYREYPGFSWNALNYIMSAAYRQFVRQPQSRFASLVTPAEAVYFFHAPGPDGSPAPGKD